MSNKEIQVKRMMTYFIEAANEIIEKEGIENVTLRKVSKMAGYNTATLYNYFHDLDHLIFFASMKYLREYTLGLDEIVKESGSQYELFIEMWKFFCSISFKNPGIYYQLFFGKHSERIDTSIIRYYEIFPEELGEHSVETLTLLYNSSFSEKNRNVLKSLAEEDVIPKDKVDMINEMIIYIYQSMLLRKINKDIDLNSTQLGEKMIQYILYLLHVHEAKISYY